ncbi:hypothetical protein GOBAR_AA07752 [Gossypium barbadense]|uniref:Uncharacterized protein n=1 Tax=Gossypium barbadense TaxID=3634 RepID=A0A2P5YBD1_GOSBA|nr:hypothetical protein GOBAR_AA07752 [Gossypium barbadense]
MSSSSGKKAVVPTSKKRKGESSSSSPTTEAQPLIAGRWIDWAAIEQVQLAETIWALLTIDLWELFFRIIEPTYLEITMELCSPFHLHTIMINCDDPGTIQFQRPKIGTVLGLYTEEFKEENDLHALNRHIYRSPSRCWDALDGKRALASSTLTMPTFYGVCHTTPTFKALEGGYLYLTLRYSVGSILRAPQHHSPRIILNPHRPDEEAYEDIPDDVPPQHEDPPTQPPPPSHPVHAMASYADISERLTRFEQQCFQQIDNIDATLQQICQHLHISSPIPPRPFALHSLTHEHGRCEG